MSANHSVQGDGAHGHGDHPKNSFYWIIGAILAVVTFVEVWVTFVEALKPIEAPLLVFLSAIKVIMVVMFFMHLKMDSKVFTGVFIAGVILATFMVSALVLLYNYLPNLQF